MVKSSGDLSFSDLTARLEIGHPSHLHMDFLTARKIVGADGCPRTLACWPATRDKPIAIVGSSPIASHNHQGDRADPPLRIII